MPSAVILAAAVALTAVLAEERTTCVAGDCAVADRADRVRGALFGTFVADALSMPVHWYYDTRQLAADYGFVTDYLAPQARHAGSIMGKSNTGGHGRGGQSGDIIGRVINHGKRDLWLRPSVHYHVGMRAGETHPQRRRGACGDGVCGRPVRSWWRRGAVRSGRVPR